MYQKIFNNISCLIILSSRGPNSSFSPAFDNLNNMSQKQIQKVLTLLVSSQYDLSSCLSNCSNQGICSLDVLTQQYICSCNSGFIGKACQTDQRPCARSRCLNNATCLNLNVTGYVCQCSSGIFFGEFCQYKNNICANRTCSLNGDCRETQSETYCKCFTGFSGDDCQVVEMSTKIVKGVQMTTTILSMACLVSLACLVLGNDFLKYLNIVNEHIDIDEWRREKLHGKITKTKTKSKLEQNKKKKILRNTCINQKA